jgi:hypothetical protein
VLVAIALALVVVLVVVVVLVRRGGGDEGTPGPQPSATSSGGGASSGQLAWAPPELTDPTTVQLTADHKDLKLDQDRDYILKMPTDGPLEAKGTSIWGGRNVVLIGGEISVPADDRGRGLALKSQTGTVHVEGLRITGPGLTEGIDLQEGDGAVVQLENVRVDAPQGSRSTNHADVIQSWAGPKVLRIDRFTASTTYQGFFMLPTQHTDQGPPDEFDLRHVDLHGLKDSGYMLWRDSDDWPLKVTDVYVQRPDEKRRNQLLWPKKGKGTEVWSQVHIGNPPGGSFVGEDVAGVGYQSPGYAS